MKNPLREAVVQRSSAKNVFLKHLCQSPFFSKAAGLRPATSLKKDSGTEVSGEFCEIYNKTFSYRTPLVAASDLRNPFSLNPIMD